MIELLEYDSHFVAKRGKQKKTVKKRNKIDTKIEQVEIYLGELRVRESNDPKLAIFFN